MDLYMDGPFAFVVQPDGMICLTLAGGGTHHTLHLFPSELREMEKDYDDMRERAAASNLSALR